MLRSWMNTVQRKCCTTVLLILVFSLISNQVNGQETVAKRKTVPDTWLDDADLHDISFVDSKYGWAVGDHGAIWHTQNGGEIWRIQKSQVSCQLSSVHFVDRQRGWAAGGVAVPLTQASRGLLLQTEDGGKTWKQTDGLLLPWITGIRFSDQHNGIAVGLTSSLYPSGAWTTSDGGRTWSPLSGVQGTSWVDYDFPRQEGSISGLLAGHDGRVARVTQRRISTVLEKGDGWNHESFLTMVNPTVYFTGQQTLQLTVDSGRSWQPIDTFQPFGIQQRMQVNAMSNFGSNCWLAGAPGNRILFSHDHGGNWESAVSPSTLPLERLHFLSDMQGWAVGARGTILSTLDGGVTWKRQRGGMKRIAMLAVFADERDIPWDLLSHVSAVDEFRVHIVLITTVDGRDQGQLKKRLQHAAMQVGATAEILTQAAMDASVDLPAAKLIQRWQSQNPRAMDWLAERLTQIVRARRPDVVLTSEWGGERSDTSSQRLVSQLAADACDYAASDQAFVEQFRDFGLSVWNVSRALKCVARQGNRIVAKSNRKSALGDSAEELADIVRNIMSESKPKSAWTLRSLRKADSQADMGTQPFAGMAVEYGSAARRARSPRAESFNSNRSLALALGRMNKRGLHRVEQIEQLAGGDADLAARLLFKAAETEADRSEQDMLRRQFVARHESHPLMDVMLQRLVEHHTSLEQQWRAYRTKRVEVGNAGVANGEEGVQQVSATSEVFAADWNSAFRLMQEIKSKRPTLYAEPQIAFPLAALKRLEKPDGANSLMQRQLKLPSQWKSHAQLELDLAGATGDAERLIENWSCKMCPTRPHLDGDLGDEIWKTTQFQELRPTPANLAMDPSQEPTLIGFAKDAGYLYLAAYCPKRAHVKYDPSRQKRPRDVDLHAHDRISVNLDINRDYHSWWSFTFDHRGWTRDALNDDLQWNPKYFVAAKSDDHVWTIEAAIPLDELAPLESQTSSYWAIGVQRVVPKVQIEHWNATDNGENPPNLQAVMHLQ